MPYPLPPKVGKRVQWCKPLGGDGQSQCAAAARGVTADPVSHTLARREGVTLCRQQFHTRAYLATDRGYTS